MKKRVVIAVLACLGALTLGVALAQAAKVPTYHVYKNCSKSGICNGAAYLNGKQNRVVVAQASKKCSDGSYAAVNFSGRTRVSSKRRFSVKVQSSNYDITAQTSVTGVGTITGTVSKKKRVTMKFSLDHAPSACGTVSKVKIVAKYKGTQTGG